MPWTYPPPYPAPPLPRVYLTPGVGQPTTEITSYLSQETAPLLTSTIENPTDTNNFTAADVTLKGYDPSGVVKGLFSGILPTSTDFGILITLGLPGSLGGVLSYQNDATITGFVAPATVQFNPKDKSFSFTVIGQARNLQTTSAAALFLRTAEGYFDTKWYLYQDLAPKDNVARVTSSTNNTCDFQAGDTIQVADAEKFIVVDVAPDTTSSPPAYWELRLYLPPTKTYAAGIQSAVKLLTPYARNKSLHDVVAALYNAAGFPSEGYFGSAALPNSGALFATPVNMTGLPVGPVSGIAPIGGQLVAGTPQGIYAAAGPTSAFSFLVNKKLPPIDPTNTGTAGGYTGPKRTRTRASAPRYGLDVTMKFFAYDSTLYGATSNRYILTVTINTNVVDEGASFTGYAFTTKLEWETYNSGTDTWGGTTTLWAGVSNTTVTDLSKAYDAIGIDVDPASGTILFTDLDVSGAGQQINMNTSSYDPTGATPATGTLTRNRATGVNGPIVFMAPSKVAVFQLDGILGNASQVKTYTVAADGAMTASVTQPMTPYLIPRSVKLNNGNGLYYGLISDPTTGIAIQYWLDWNFNQGFAVAPNNLFPPPPAAAQSTNFGVTPYDLDLVCLPTGLGAGSGVYPMVGLFGGTPYFISNQGSGLIPYVDLTDLSVADALQQLTVINAGIFYVAGFGWVFRSRSGPVPGNTIGTNDQIDGDSGFLDLTQQSVFNRWVGYVRIQHETDETIFGEAGSAAFADTDQGLTLKSRFVSSKSFAAALATSLYNYLGSQKRWIEIERVRDGRTYEVGRTFHCYPDGYGVGVNRNFQIIETGHPVTGVTVKVVGLEV